MSERLPDPALEDRVVDVLVASGDIRRRAAWRLPVSLTVAFAAGVLLLLHPWSSPAPRGEEYVLLLHDNPEFVQPAPGHMNERRAEYGRWADSLFRLGELERGGRLEGDGVVDGLFIIRAKNQAEADSIGQSCPHAKYYHGIVEVRRYIE